MSAVRSFLLLTLLLLLLVGCGGESMKTFRSVNVQATLTDIHKAALRFQTDNQYWPPSVDVLESGGYIEIDAKQKRQWRFDILSEEILAISTKEMPDGAGQELSYDFVEDQFHGYGVKEGGGWR